MKTTKELIIADITAKVEAKLASQKVDLSAVDDIKNASASVKKQYDSVFSKTILIKSQIDEALKIGNKAFFEAQKFYKEGLKVEQQAKELGVAMPTDFKNAMQILYENSQLEGEQIIKDLTSAKKIIG